MKPLMRDAIKSTDSRDHVYKHRYSTENQLKSNVIKSTIGRWGFVHTLPSVVDYRKMAVSKSTMHYHLYAIEKQLMSSFNKVPSTPL